MSMNYQNFEIEDFVADDYFKNWVLQPNAESESFWNHYLAQFPERSAVVEDARLLIIGLREAEAQHFPVEKQQRFGTTFNKRYKVMKIDN